MENVRALARRSRKCHMATLALGAGLITPVPWPASKGHMQCQREKKDEKTTRMRGMPAHQQPCTFGGACNPATQVCKPASLSQICVALHDKVLKNPPVFGRNCAWLALGCSWRSSFPRTSGFGSGSAYGRPSWMGALV